MTDPLEVIGNVVRSEVTGRVYVWNGRRWSSGLTYCDTPFLRSDAGFSLLSVPQPATNDDSNTR